jgi:prenylcysteine oxidase / farnesylcysteine lyase
MNIIYMTFVQKYFGLSSVEEIPDLVGTLETPGVPFSSVSILKKYSEGDFTYKIFSRSELDDSLLNQLFR